MLSAPLNKMPYCPFSGKRRPLWQKIRTLKIAVGIFMKTGRRQTGKAKRFTAIAIAGAPTGRIIQRPDEAFVCGGSCRRPVMALLCRKKTVKSCKKSCEQIKNAPNSANFRPLGAFFYLLGICGAKSACCRSTRWRRSRASRSGAVTRKTGPKDNRLMSSSVSSSASYRRLMR